MVYFIGALKSAIFPLFFIMSYCFLVCVFVALIGSRLYFLQNRAKLADI